MSLQDDPDYQNINNERHKRFIQNILAGKSSTNAYAEVFPKANRKNATKNGYKLKNRYANIIERATPIGLEQIEKVAHKTLSNLTLMAFADLGGIVDANGQPRPLHKVPRDIRMAITEVQIEGSKITYKVGGKLKAMEILSRIARLQEDRQEINISLITEEERDSKVKEIVINAMKRENEEVEES